MGIHFEEREPIKVYRGPTIGLKDLYLTYFPYVIMCLYTLTSFGSNTLLKGLKLPSNPYL